MQEMISQHIWLIWHSVWYLEMLWFPIWTRHGKGKWKWEKTEIIRLSTESIQLKSMAHKNNTMHSRTSTLWTLQDNKVACKSQKLLILLLLDGFPTLKTTAQTEMFQQFYSLAPPCCGYAKRSPNRFCSSVWYLIRHSVNDVMRSLVLCLIS